MGKIIYLECPTGIAGDMCLGSLLELGVPLEYLTEKLAQLGISNEYQLIVKKIHHHGQIATKFDVNLNMKLTTDSVKNHQHHHHDHEHNHDVPKDHDHSNHLHPHHRHLPEIEDLISGANLPPRAAEWSLKVFRQLAVAEGAVHGIDPNQVHFHEVGAVDAIVDIVGTCLGFDYLDVDQIVCSPLPTGGGTVKAAHGILPVPVPAVLKLCEMRQVPIYYNGIDRELVTPTGAALCTSLAQSFGPPPQMMLKKVGLGAGTLSLKIPNILRMWLGESYGEKRVDQGDEVVVLETQIDDVNPQAIGYIYDRLLSVGAKDVFTQSIMMKKSRPGFLLSVICAPELVSKCEEIIFRETSTLGIRKSHQSRSILEREFQQVKTSYGTVNIKIGHLDQNIINIQPEYEDCATLARKYDVPWLTVHQEAIVSWHQQLINS